MSVRGITAAIVVTIGVLGACSDPSTPPSITDFAIPESAPSIDEAKEPPMPGSCPGYARPDPNMDCFNAGTFSGTCEYGHDIDKQCNEIFTCNGGRWQRQSNTANCLNRCPETFQEIKPGEPCLIGGLGCSYFEGTCGCVADTVGVRDGGAVGRWKCAPPPQGGCPRQRPPLTEDCVRPMVCDYGTCEIGGGFELTYSCSGRVWVQADTKICP